jgi:MqsR (Motility quorum-sensing regulator) toxin of toxin-antitoxin system
MEKRKPTYDLEGFRQECSSVKALRMTRTAQDATLRLGLLLEDVVQVVQTMTRGHFYKSMTSLGRPPRLAGRVPRAVGRACALREAHGGRSWGGSSCR